MTIASGPYRPDALDERLFDTFPGLVIREDLTSAIRGMSKAPSYVIEFMLGKYCANHFDDDDVRGGLQLVQEEIARYIPRGDETEVIKSQIRERPPRRLIDMVKVELDEKLGKGKYWATFLCANSDHVNIQPALVERYERLLMAEVWSNVLVQYDDSNTIGKRTYPFVISRLEPVQVGSIDIEEYRRGRAQFTRDQWIDALIRTMGYEPTHPEVTERVKPLYLVRMIPLVEGNYHLIELGPRQTGKSFCFIEFSPYGTLLAGGSVTVPRLFVSNTQRLRPGLIANRDIIGFDEIAGSAFDADDDKNLYDYTSEICHRELRRISSYGNLWDRWFEATPNEWSARDLRSVNRTFSGLTKLIFPDGMMTKDDARLLLRLALELRLRVRVQLNRISSHEFPLTAFSFRDRETEQREAVRLEAV